MLNTTLDLMARIAAMPVHYTPAPVILGWEAEYLISAAGTDPTAVGVPFGSKGGRIAYNVDQHECGDSNNGRAKAEKNGRYQLDVTINFYEKHNVTAIPDFDVDEIAIALYENGVSAPSGETQKQPWIIPSFMLGPVVLDWDVDGKMNGTLTGLSNGAFTVPGN